LNEAKSFCVLLKWNESVSDRPKLSRSPYMLLIYWHTDTAAPSLLVYALLGLLLINTVLTVEMIPRRTE